MSAFEDREAYMRRQEADHDLLRMRTGQPVTRFRSSELYDLDRSLGWLRSMGRQGEDYVWRGADAARATMERLAAALEEIRIKSTGDIFKIADKALRFDSAKDSPND